VIGIPALFTGPTTDPTLRSVKSMKSTIGKLLAVLLLASGLGLLAASPSSALPRDICMEEAEYLHADSWYQAQTINYFDVMMGWVNADHYTNPLSGQETWTANGVYVYSLADYDHKLSSSQYDYGHSYAQMLNFENNTNVCP